MKLSDIRGSKSFMAVNPHLVGELSAKESKPTVAQALVGLGQKLKEGEAGSIKWVVVLTCHRRRLLDDDNNVGSLKPIRDALANHLGVDDGSQRIKFEYHQIKTIGRPGVSVTIHEYEHLPKSDRDGQSPGG